VCRGGGIINREVKLRTNEGQKNIEKNRLTLKTRKDQNLQIGKVKIKKKKQEKKKKEWYGRMSEQNSQLMNFSQNGGGKKREVVSIKKKEVAKRG